MSSDHVSPYWTYGGIYCESDEPVGQCQAIVRITVAQGAGGGDPAGCDRRRGGAVHRTRVRGDVDRRDRRDGGSQSPHCDVDRRQEGFAQDRVRRGAGGRRRTHPLPAPAGLARGASRTRSAPLRGRLRGPGDGHQPPSRAHLRSRSRSRLGRSRGPRGVRGDRPRAPDRGGPRRRRPRRQGWPVARGARHRGGRRHPLGPDRRRPVPPSGLPARLVAGTVRRLAGGSIQRQLLA